MNSRHCLCLGGPWKKNPLAGKKMICKTRRHDILRKINIIQQPSQCGHENKIEACSHSDSVGGIVDDSETDMAVSPVYNSAQSV